MLTNRFSIRSVRLESLALYFLSRKYIIKTEIQYKMQALREKKKKKKKTSKVSKKKKKLT